MIRAIVFCMVAALTGCGPAFTVGVFSDAGDAEVRSEVGALMDEPSPENAVDAGASPDVYVDSAPTPETAPTCTPLPAPPAFKTVTCGPTAPQNQWSAISTVYLEYIPQQNGCGGILLPPECGCVETYTCACVKAYATPCVSYGSVLQGCDDSSGVPVVTCR